MKYKNICQSDNSQFVDLISPAPAGLLRPLRQWKKICFKAFWPMVCNSRPPPRPMAPTLRSTTNITTSTAEAEAWIRKSLGKDKINASRQPVEGTTKGGSKKSKNRSIKHVCPCCGTIIRATREVNVICRDCGEPFKRAENKEGGKPAGELHRQATWK